MACTQREGSGFVPWLPARPWHALVLGAKRLFGVDDVPWPFVLVHAHQKGGAEKDPPAGGVTQTRLKSPPLCVTLGKSQSLCFLIWTMGLIMVCVCAWLWGMKQNDV